MKKLILLTVLACLPALAAAQDNTAKTGWEVELKRIGFNFTSTSVRHAEEYQGFPDSRLSAKDQTTVQGDLNFFAGYYTNVGLWSNTLTAQYGRNKVTPHDGTASVTSENADSIKLTTDYAFKMWDWPDLMGGFSFGPFVNGEYETEFTANAGARRKQVLRARSGLKLFNGKYLTDLHIAGVYEYDFTYQPASNNFAVEVAARAEHPLREGVKASYGAYFRDYISYSQTHDTNLDYELGADARLDVLVVGNFAVAPVIKYFLAQGTYRADLGQNVYVGVSFTWSRLFKAAATN